MLLVIHLIIIGIFILLGVAFYFGKGAWLIAGYNTSSAAEKAKYDEKKLCKGMAKLMFALAVCWMLIACSEIFQTMVLLWVGLCLFLIVITLGIILMNTGIRFKK